MSEADIIEDFPELEIADIRACLAFAADREQLFSAIAELVEREKWVERNSDACANMAR